MRNDPITGYTGWTWLDLSAGEDSVARTLSASFNRIVKMEGGPAMELTIRKAALTISQDEARSGAGHRLADGQPFYHCRISTTDQGMGVNVVLMLAQAFGQHGGASVIMDDKTEVLIDRRSLNDMGLLPSTAGHAVRMLKVRQ